MKDNKENKNPLELEGDGGKQGNKTSLGLALGMCFGSALGMLGMGVTGEFWWVSIGVSLGLALGLVFGGIQKHNKKNE